METTDNIIKSSFPVQGMGCAACATKIEQVLNGLDGVVSSSVDLKSAQVLVEYNANLVSPQQMKDAIHKVGYNVLIDGDNHP